MIIPLHSTKPEEIEFVDEQEVLNCVLTTMPKRAKKVHPSWECLRFESTPFKTIYESASTLLSPFSWSLYEIGGG